ncbi:MAG: YncE family protein [Gemmatimonadales bacterium]|jgi:DNA-binding beta-propeller fold protein YncE|nr:YncE family protein [Gemmatimonadales bacterium]
MRRGLAALATLLACGATAAVAQAPTRDYLAWIGSEATDEVARVRFGPAGARVEHVQPVGIIQSDPDGPHGVGVSPDGRHYYVSTAHGVPFGYLWKFTTAGDTLLGKVELGHFPATLQVSPDGAFVWVVNFNLHGEMVPSSVSVVAADELVEVARITTCRMPHGSRLNPQGTRHYSACMMDEMMVEIDARSLAVSRHFMLTRGAEHGMAGAPAPEGAHGDHDMGGHGLEQPKGPDQRTCSPTWAQPSADGARVYVACNRTSDVVEVDVATWTMTRRIPMGNGVYNLAVTRNGRYLIGTNKRDQSVSIIELRTGREAARLTTARKVVHGVAVSPDDRYAFVSVEGIGSEPGTLEIIDLDRLATVATVNVGQMAGGVDVSPR